MKNPKDIRINSELNFYPIVDAETNKVRVGRWIGAVEVVVDGYQDEDGWEYVTEYFLAFQLKSGRIVYVDSPFGSLVGPFMIFSLKGKMFDIHWGYFPVDFPDEWKFCVTAPVENPPGIEPVETEQLPF